MRCPNARSWSIAPAIACAWLAGCLAEPPEAASAAGPAVARLVAGWDPLACGDPHRVVLELADAADATGATGATATATASAPCSLGGVAVDLPHLGSYAGRIYGWSLDAAPHPVTPVAIDVDLAIVHWRVATPP
jgi:hypothetical protein